MNLLVLVARLLLVSVFGVAAIAKLADRRGAVKAAHDFGAPTWAARPLSWLIPFAELAAAALLVSQTLSWWGAVAALSLLGVFSAAIAASLTRGRKPDCHCFGQLHSAPISWKTLGRNVALWLVAGLIIWQSPSDGRKGSSLLSLWPAAHDPLTTVWIIAALGIISILAWSVLHLFLQHGRLLLRIEQLEQSLNSASSARTENQQIRLGLPVGFPAPPFEADSFPEGKISLAQLLKPAKQVLLIFSDLHCGPCNALTPQVAEWQRQHAEVLTVAVVSHGSFEEHRKKLDGQRLSNLIVQEDRTIAGKYKADVTPSGLLIRADGRIASELARGPQALADLLLRATTNRSVPAPAGFVPPVPGKLSLSDRPSAIGQVAPPIRLPDLEGRPVEIARPRGKETVLLFWNPECGFCKKMLADLKDWENSRDEGAPELFVMSTGTKEATRSLGLRSTVVLDQPFGAARSLGLHGTPSAVLLDLEGRIASEPAVGASAVLALMTRAHTTTK